MSALVLYTPGDSLEEWKLRAPTKPYSFFNKFQCRRCHARYVLSVQPTQTLPVALPCLLCQHPIALSLHQSRAFLRHSQDRWLKIFSPQEDAFKDVKLLDLSPMGARIAAPFSLSPHEPIRFLLGNHLVEAEPRWMTQGHEFEIGLKFTDPLQNEKGLFLSGRV